VDTADGQKEERNGWRGPVAEKPWPVWDYAARRP
jgi:hypothetical protein